jgi:uncharacterized coiled-coil DUF342 family protein
MKYAIYDKAAEGYLTTMDFDTEVPDNYTRYAVGYNEYITKARLLDTKEEAADVVTRIESFKFMDKGRFVMHSFDDTLKDQYIISEAGTPTKVVESITVDIDGNINVKYGTMITHWSATSLEYAINRMTALQKAKGSRYTDWCNTFDIYKVIKAIDEKGFVNYQFIKVTEKGLTEYAKEEVDSLNKRIEELERANYEFGKRLNSRGTLVTNLRVENTNLKNKIESIKKEARNWKTMYENAKRDREVLTNVIDNIYDDLSSTDICKDLKETYAYVESLSELNYIKIHNDDTADGKPIYIRAAAEFKYIINQIITIMESLELNQSVAFASADEVHKARGVAYDIIAICEANDEFYITLKKFSELYEVVNAVYNTKDDPIMHAFNSVLLIFSKVNSNLENVVSENVVWKNKAQKAEKELNDQKKMNDANKATIAQMVNVKRAMDKELSDWKMRTEEAIRDYTKCNEALGEWKKKYRAIQEERDKALERAEKFKGVANSVYGMTIPSRCNGKQMFCDIATGKKILIDKKKYDELVEWIDAINTTYDTMFFMNKPAYLPIMIEHLNDLTK